MAISGSVQRKSSSQEGHEVSRGECGEHFSPPSGTGSVYFEPPQRSSAGLLSAAPPVAQGKCSGVLEADSAVDGENLAGDELWGGREEQDGCGDFVCAAVAPHGGLFCHAAYEGRRG